MITTLAGGLLRRIFRLRMRHEGNKGNIPRTPGSQKLPGYRMKIDYPDRRIWLHQFLQIFCDDCYRTCSLPDEPIVVDVGANIGTFALNVLWRRPAARVTCVEPSPDNLGYLKRNLKSFGRHSAVVLPVAVTDHEGDARLVGSTSDALRVEHGNGGEVETVTLKSLIHEHVDLLKIDIEGSETEALAGAGGCLSHVDRVVLEYHDFAGGNTSLPGVMQMLHKQGFNRFGIRSHQELQVAAESGGLRYCCLVEAWRAEYS